MFHLSLKEPLAARYVYVNPQTNQVHLLVPIVGGVEIATDNTCKSLTTLKDFFGKNASKNLNQSSAMNSLQSYKKALEHDLVMLSPEHPLSIAKQERLNQINQYIKTLTAIESKQEIEGLRLPKPEYPNVFKKLIEEQTNLYSILLHASGLNPTLRAINPVFTVERSGEQILFNTLKNEFTQFTTHHASPQERIKQYVLTQLRGKPVNFEHIRETLTQAIYDLYGLNTDLSVTVYGELATQTYLEEQMGIRTPGTTEEYVNALLGYCANKIWRDIEESPFSGIQNDIQGREKLLVMTQFFLAQINIYCISHHISTIDFGQQLGKSADLSQLVATTVKQALAVGRSVEHALTDLINQHARTFGLNQTLSENDLQIIEKQFIAQYKSMSEHTFADEFTILDTTQQGRFVTHQASICLDFTEILKSKYTEQYEDYFKHIAEDKLTLPTIVPNNNEFTQATITLNDKEIIPYLIHLIETNHLDIVTEIIEKNSTELARIPANDLTRLSHAKDKVGQSLLQYVIKEKPYALSAVLGIFNQENMYIAQKEKNKTGYTAVMTAMLYPDILHQLLSPLAPNDRFLLMQEKNTRGDTALHLAINKPNSLKAMLEPFNHEQRMQLLKIKNQSNESVQQLLNKSPAAMNMVASLLLDTNEAPHQSTSPVTVMTSYSDDEDVSPKPAREIKSSQFTIHLNKSTEELLRDQKRNCFAFNNVQKNQLSYISKEGTVTSIEMSVVKQFGFNTKLQALARRNHYSIGEICNFNVSIDEMNNLLKTAGSSLQQVVEDKTTEMTNELLNR